MKLFIGSCAIRGAERRVRIRCFPAIVSFVFAIVASLCGTRITAQTSGNVDVIKALKYDVVSIREAGSGNQSQTMTAAGRVFSATNISIATLIQNAYGKRMDLIVGMPEWVKTKRFDITAKMTNGESFPERFSVNQQRQLLTEILVDRFQIATRNSVKIVSIYDLVVAKNGPRFATDGGNSPKDLHSVTYAGMDEGSIIINNGVLEAKQVTIASLAQSLEQELNYTVVDLTHLEGKYDLHLVWEPDRSASLGPDAHGQDTGVPLVTALQEQLGLKLQPARGPVDVVIIDHISLPSAN